MGVDVGSGVEVGSGDVVGVDVAVGEGIEETVFSAFIVTSSNTNGPTMSAPPRISSFKEETDGGLCQQNYIVAIRGLWVKDCQRTSRRRLLCRMYLYCLSGRC